MDNDGVASHAGVANASLSPGLTSDFKGSVNVDCHVGLIFKNLYYF